MRYYGGVRSELQAAVVERRSYPGSLIRINCTCGQSVDFDKVHKARAFLKEHYPHIVEWSINLLDADGEIVWTLKAGRVHKKQNKLTLLDENKK